MKLMRFHKFVYWAFYLELSLKNTTVAVFLEFVSKKYLRHILIWGNNKLKIRKNIGPPLFKFKFDITKMPLFFQISSSLVSKIEICLKYFLDKISLKQPLCIRNKIGQIFSNVIQKSELIQRVVSNTFGQNFWKAAMYCDSQQNRPGF